MPSKRPLGPKQGERKRQASTWECPGTGTPLPEESGGSHQARDGHFGKSSVGPAPCTPQFFASATKRLLRLSVAGAPPCMEEFRLLQRIV